MDIAGPPDDEQRLLDKLLIDEAQIFDAALPTMAARPNPQMWLLGTPPTPLDDGTVFSRFRADVLEGKDRRLCWAEWSAEPEPDSAGFLCV